MLPTKIHDIPMKSYPLQQWSCSFVVKIRSHKIPVRVGKAQSVTVVTLVTVLTLVTVVTIVTVELEHREVVKNEPCSLYCI